MYVLKLVEGATSIGAKPEIAVPLAVKMEKQGQAAAGVISGAGSATVVVEGRPDPTHPWITLRTLAIVAPNTAEDGNCSIYPEMRANVTVIGGGMSVDCVLLVYDRST